MSPYRSYRCSPRLVSQTLCLRERNRTHFRCGKKHAVISLKVKTTKPTCAFHGVADCKIKICKLMERTGKKHYFTHSKGAGMMLRWCPCLCVTAMFDILISKHGKFLKCTIMQNKSNARNNAPLKMFIIDKHEIHFHIIQHSLIHLQQSKTRSTDRKLHLAHNSCIVYILTTAQRGQCETA